MTARSTLKEAVFRGATACARRLRRLEACLRPPAVGGAAAFLASCVSVCGAHEFTPADSATAGERRCTSPSPGPPHEFARRGPHPPQHPHLWVRSLLHHPIHFALHLSGAVLLSGVCPAGAPGCRGWQSERPATAPLFAPRPPLFYPPGCFRARPTLDGTHDKTREAAGADTAGAAAAPAVSNFWRERARGARLVALLAELRAGSRHAARPQYGRRGCRGSGPPRAYSSRVTGGRVRLGAPAPHAFPTDWIERHTTQLDPLVSVPKPKPHTLPSGRDDAAAALAGKGSPGL